MNMYALSLKASFLPTKTVHFDHDNIWTPELCGRVIEPMVQCVGFTVGLLPPTSTLRPPDKCSQFPSFFLFFFAALLLPAPLYNCYH